MLIPVLVALVVTACSSSPPPSSLPTPSPGVTRTAVSVEQADDLTGAQSGPGLGARDGTNAYFAYVNSEGGVNGRKIGLVVENTGSQPQVVDDATSIAIKDDFAIVGGYSVDDYAEKPLLAKAKMPDVAVPLDPALSDLPTSYSPLPNPDSDYPLTVIRALKAKFPAASAHVGILWNDLTTSARASEEAFVRAADSQGLTVVSDTSFPSDQTTFLPDVTAMQAKGVQLLFGLQMSAGQASALADEMQQQHFDPVVVQTDAYAPSLVSTGGSAVNNMYLAVDYVLYANADAALPAVRLFDKWVKIADPATTFPVQALYGWISAQLFVQALRQAGSPPTRARLESALDKITAFDAGGLIATSDPAHNVPSPCAVLAQVENGQVERVAPTPKTGFLCAPGAFSPAPGFKPEVR